MITAQTIYDMAMDFMDKRNQTGVIDTTKTARYRVRTPSILTSWQSELAKTGDLYSKKEIPCKPIPSLFGLISGFDTLEHLSVDLTKEVTKPCKAYSFEVDGEATIYIEDYTTQWNVLATINVPSDVISYTNYNGIVTPTNGATKSRIRFSGSYYYKATNYALFDYPLKASQVPKYAPWVKYQMPADFKSVDQIIDEYPDRQYAKDSTYKWEGRKDLYLNYYYEGKVRIVYKPIPIPITDLSQTLEVDDITAMSGAYFLASHLLLTEDPATASFFNGRFMELKIESNIKQPASIQDIVDVYNISGGVNWNG